MTLGKTILMATTALALTGCSIETSEQSGQVAAKTSQILGSQPDDSTDRDELDQRIAAYIEYAENALEENKDDSSDRTTPQK